MSESPDLTTVFTEHKEITGWTEWKSQQRSHLAVGIKGGSLEEVAWEVGSAKRFMRCICALVRVTFKIILHFTKSTWYT